MKNKILFVDDELLYRKLYGDVLIKAGFDVDFANDGEEALEMIKKRRPSLVIVDLIMPIMSGTSLLKKIKRRKIPTIVLTTLEGDTDREDSLALEVKVFLSKDNTNPSILLKKVKKVLSGL